MSLRTYCCRHEKEKFGAVLLIFFTGIFLHSFTPGSQFLQQSWLQLGPARQALEPGIGGLHLGQLVVMRNAGDPTRMWEMSLFWGLGEVLV